MFKQKSRLRLKKDIEAVFQKGKSIFSKNIGVKFLFNNSKNSRYLVVASKKISKKAVKRNLLKRRLRAAIQNNSLNFQSGFDVMIITRPGAQELKYKELELELMTIFKKIGISKEK